MNKQAGTGPSRRHIQGSKIAKGLLRVNLQYSKIEKAKKNVPSGAPGPANASPWRAKRGHFRNCQHFCRVEGGTLWRKNKFSKKKSHNAEKLERGTLWGFSTSILSQNIKKLRKIFSEKKLRVPKIN